ncbi:MAG TPA: hypothetical protein VHG32_26955 [Thermoanaerobaculia bacterium]|jgi:hypothetical protein|nr:hypothetical protein [Thermoanaerobaculia bacterium]
MGDMVEIWVRLMKLPWSVFNWGLAGSTRMVERMRLAAGDGVERMLAPLAAAGGKDLTTLGTGDPGAATTLKEEKKMSDDSCGVTDCTIKLVQYTIVSIERGKEEILDQGKKLVTEPMDECDFDNWVIADFLCKNPNECKHNRRYLRVASEVLDTWQKQPLHYHEEQLKYLKRIAEGVNQVPS